MGREDRVHDQAADRAHDHAFNRLDHFVPFPVPFISPFAVPSSHQLIYLVTFAHLIPCLPYLYSPVLVACLRPVPLPAVSTSRAGRDVSRRVAVWPPHVRHFILGDVVGCRNGRGYYRISQNVMFGKQ